MCIQPSETPVAMYASFGLYKLGFSFVGVQPRLYGHCQLDTTVCRTSMGVHLFDIVFQVIYVFLRYQIYFPFRLKYVLELQVMGLATWITRVRGCNRMINCSSGLRNISWWMTGEDPVGSIWRRQASKMSLSELTKSALTASFSFHALRNRKFSFIYKRYLCPSKKEQNHTL
jgi:hypothetical protein